MSKKVAPKENPKKLLGTVVKDHGDLVEIMSKYKDFDGKKCEEHFYRRPDEITDYEE